MIFKNLTSKHIGNWTFIFYARFKAFKLITENYYMGYNFDKYLRIHEKQKYGFFFHPLS